MKNLFKTVRLSMVFAIILVIAVMVAGCGSSQADLKEFSAQGKTSSITILTPVEMKTHELTAADKAKVKKNKGIEEAEGFEGHDSDYQVIIADVFFNREVIEKSNKKAWSPNLDENAEKMAKTMKKNFKATDCNIEDTTVNNTPAKLITLHYNRKEIDLEMKAVYFFVGDELWGVSAACRNDNEDAKKVCSRIISEIKF